MFKGVFITGTDTGVGKTWFTVILMEALKKQGHQVAGMKPIASGAILDDGSLINEDARLIMHHCSKVTRYDLINPVVFEPPVAPHIAATQKKEIIDLDQIVSSYDQLALNSKIVIVEGIGGWRVPISDKTSMVDLVRMLDLPVIMVVGIRLGCINHAILSAEAIRADGITLCGWVSNQLDKDYLFKQETIDTLNEKLACPRIADLSYMKNFEPDEMLDRINLSLIYGCGRLKI